MSDKRGQVLSLLRDYPDATYEKIGSIVGYSRQRIHQVAKEAGLTKKRWPPHYRSDVTVDKALELYHRDLSITGIASILGCNRITVKKRLREAGIISGAYPLGGMGPNCRVRLNCRGATVEGVLNLYLNDGLLIKEIAQTMSCDKATVRRRLREARIPKRDCLSRGARIRWQRNHSTK